MQKQKGVINEKLTIEGTARFPKLNSPDFKYDTDGKYEVDVVLSEENKASLQATLTTFLANAKASFERELGLSNLKTMDIPFKAEIDKDKQETGAVFLKVKSKAKFTDSAGNTVENKPVIYDKYGKVTEELVMMGAQIKVAALAKSYLSNDKRVGVTFKLLAVMVTENVSNKSFESLFGDVAEEEGVINPEL